MARILVIPAERSIRIDDVLVSVPEGSNFPDAPDLEGFVVDDRRAIRVISFDGVYGVVERNSRAPKRHDMEHFLGAGCLNAYVAAHEVEVARLAEEKAKHDAEEAARAEASAEAIRKEAAKSKAKGKGKANK